ncbi:MAG: hypothetical protein FOGNACKC_02526 [Anaerolineae bacterium]|nr:hypothetical protein [Anaerolineae bacterium]
MSVKKLAVVFAPLLGLIFAGAVLAQQGVNEWLRFDVRLNLQQNSGLSVEEIHEVALASGVTQFTRIIPTDRLEAIQNVQVSQLSGGGQRGFVQADTGQDFTFETKPVSASEMEVTLHFPPNNASSTTFVLRYFVAGVVRFYGTGDWLDWRPYGGSAPGAIKSSTIEIRLPSGFTKNQLKPASTGVAAEAFVPEDNRVEFRANNVARGDELEVSLQFPHGVVAGTSPAWQQQADSLAYWSPILGWGSLAVALLLLLAGPLAAYGWWYWKLRIAPPKAKIPHHLNLPPSKLSPAVAGMLLDGKSMPRHISATLLDLAARGALHAFPAQPETNPLFEEEAEKERELAFDLYGVDQNKAVRSYEATLYSRIFGFQGSRKRSLADMRRALFMAVPEIKTQIEADVAKAAVFQVDRERVRRQYLAFGGAAVLFSLILGLVVLVIFSRFTYMVACPFMGVAVAAIAFIAAGYAAPKHTVVGQKHAVRWEAFRRYLKDMDTAAAKQAQSNYARLLPYAVALGVDKGFTEKFAAVKTPAPAWWSIPPEKLPDTSHQDAHDWVSARQRPQAQQQRTKSVIRRLGEPEQMKAGLPLKEIQPEFTEFLSQVAETFSKAPPMDETELPEADLTGGRK